MVSHLFPLIVLELDGTLYRSRYNEKGFSRFCCFTPLQSPARTFRLVFPSCPSVEVCAVLRLDGRVVGRTRWAAAHRLSWDQTFCFQLERVSETHGGA